MSFRLARSSAPGEEGGFVMVIVIITLMIALLLGAAALAETLDSRSLTTRDGHARQAQQAADAGIQTELYQQSENAIGNSNSSFDLNGGILNAAHFLDCIEPSLNASGQITGLAQVNVSVSGVCPNPTPPGQSRACDLTVLGGHAFACSEYIPGASAPISGASEADLAPKIVSLAWTGSSTPASSDAFAREEAILAPISPLPVVSGNGNVALTGFAGLGLSLATTLEGDVDAANALTLPYLTVSANPKLINGLLSVIKCGCSRPSGIAVANFDQTTVSYRQPITVSAGKADCPSPDSNGASGCSDIASYYSAATDSVSVPAGKTMTIYGGDYVFCNFSAAGTVNANPSASQPVRIFIDSPTSSRCSGNSPMLTATNSQFANHTTFWTEGNFTAASGINNSEGLTTPSGLQIYVVGDEANPAYDDNTFVQVGTQPTSTGLTSNVASEAAIVYAPTSDVSMTTASCVSLVTVSCTGGTFEGNLIGDDVSATATTFVQALDLANDPLYNGVNAFHVEQHVQCSPLPKDASGNTYTSLQGNTLTDTNGC